jgi:aspartate-semialdehyde dehydrogenase
MSAESMRVALVGAEDLQARAMFEALKEGGYASSQILPLAGTLGALEISLAEDDTAEVFLPLTRERVDEVRVVALFSSDAETRAEVLKWVAEGGQLLMDLSSVAGSETALFDPLVGGRDEEYPPSGFRLPDPGALYIARALAYLSEAVQGAVCVQAFLPASRFGEAGVRELFAQATSLLKFSPLPTEVLGRQTAFNCWPVDLPGFSETFTEDLRDLSGMAELPVVYSGVQCGSFHCTALSVLLRVKSAERAAAQVKKGLSGDDVFEPWVGDGWPSLVDMAGKERPVALARPLDRETLRLWLVYDNAKAGQGSMAARILLGRSAV